MGVSSALSAKRTSTSDIGYSVRVKIRSCQFPSFSSGMTIIVSLLTTLSYFDTAFPNEIRTEPILGSLPGVTTSMKRFPLSIKEGRA